MPKTDNAKTPKSFRLSTRTFNDIAQLAAHRGTSESEIITIAIDRMKQEEIEMKKQFVPYSSDARYEGIGHAPALGQPGHGNAVKHVNDPNDVGRIIQSNSERSLVQFGNSRDWYPNTELKVHVRHIASE